MGPGLCCHFHSSSLGGGGGKRAGLRAILILLHFGDLEKSKGYSAISFLSGRLWLMRVILTPSAAVSRLWALVLPAPVEEACTHCCVCMGDEMVQCAWSSPCANSGTACSMNKHLTLCACAFAGSLVCLLPIFICGEWQKKSVPHLCMLMLRMKH